MQIRDDQQAQVLNKTLCTRSIIEFYRRKKIDRYKEQKPWRSQSEYVERNELIIRYV